MLKTNHEKKGTVDIIILEGILNADTSQQLEAILEPISGADEPRVLVHLADLTYISSAGIGCFIGVIRRIRTQGGDIRFSDTNPKVKRVFQLLDMEDFFQFHASMEQGLQSYNS